MANSPEYPDLKWVQPASWDNSNRTSVQLIVIHTTEGSAHGQSAEDGAAYDARRTDGTSTHYFHDCDSTVHCVRTEDQAHTARKQGNKRGIHHELCGKAGWSASTWSNDYCTAMLKRAAKQCARDAAKWGIPIKHLTVSEVDAGKRGFCSHHDITRAFPEDGGTHTDPGPNFPWSRFLDMVRAEAEGDDMALTEDQTETAAGRGWHEQTVGNTGVKAAVMTERTYDYVTDATKDSPLWIMLRQIDQKLDALLAPPPPDSDG